MGTFTLSTQNRLFWLGRYSERVYFTLQLSLDQYDRLIDGSKKDHIEYCSQLGIPCPYENSSEFLTHYLFDKDYPWSIRSSIDNMLGNGMVLRETIGTPSLAYLQMAQNAMDQAEKSAGPAVQLQWVIDDIMSFRGSLDTSVETEAIANIIRAGGFVERISLMLRVNWHLERLDAELKKLLYWLKDTDLQVNRTALDTIQNYVNEQEQVETRQLISAVEGLFIV